MAITFSPNQQEGHYLNKLTGGVTDVELLNSYKNHYEDDKWIPSLNELVDLSEADMTKITSDGLRALSVYIKNLFVERGISDYHTSVYAPGNVQFGIARIYDAMTEDSPEIVRVFRQLSDATLWLKEKQNGTHDPTAD